MQTAVQFIIEDIIKQVGEESYYSEANKEPRMVLEKALAMEKEQIVEAYNVGCTEIEEPNFKNGTDYYNQTYNQ